jgi:hypothetical protein
MEDVEPPPQAEADDAIRAVLKENERLREGKQVYRLAAEGAEVRIEAALAEINTVRAVGDHYLEGILARTEKALRGENSE